MRKTRNITVAVTERAYWEARVFAARKDKSVSGVVQFLLEHLPLLAQAIGNLLEEDPNFGSEPLARPYQRRQQKEQKTRLAR
jgi:hypothetical protein